MTPENSKIESHSPTVNSRRRWLVFFVVLIIFTYFFGLSIPFVGPDEARYAQVAREMLERGDWMTPTLGGFDWFEKPVLLYWIEMVSYKLFGISEFAGRFGPALFGLGTVASLWLLGRAVERTSEKAEMESGFANYLALITASTIGIIVFSRGASFDIGITFPITAALVCFYVYHTSMRPPATAGGTDPLAERRRRIYLPLFLFYAFVGFALLAKGLIGILFPFATVGLFHVLSRRKPSRAFILSLIWGTLLSICVASVWYLPMYWRHGNRFIDEFFIQQQFQRFTSNKYQHPQPLYFFFWVLPLMMLPWLPFFLAALWKFGKQIFQHRATEVTEIDNEMSPDLTSFSSPLLKFSAAWLIVPLVFFSFSGSKLPGYILPAVPGAIVLTSLYVFQLVQKSKTWRNAVPFIAGSTFLLTIALLILAVPRFAESDSVKSLIQAANERGYGSSRILTFHTISNNAEFYAAGRLVRDAEGKQRRLSDVSEVVSEIHGENAGTVLVIVSIKDLPQLTGSDNLKTELIKDNGELAIIAASRK